MTRKRVLVSGRVQGVGFRQSTFEQVGLVGGVTGHVRNLPDGRVEAIFQGEEGAVIKMIEWCRRGPVLSKVDGVEVQEEEPQTSQSGFEILL